MPKSSRKSRPLWVRALGWFAYSVLCVFALLCGSAAGWINTSDVVKMAGGPLALLHPADPRDVFGTHMFTLLVLGCDENRTTGGARIVDDKARSDMMLVAQFDFDKGLISGISIPRDTLVGFGSHREQKINAYHAIGGNELAKEAVEALLPGVGIDRVVTLDFAGFRDMVDDVGGVPIFVDKTMNWDDNAGHLHIHLRKGYQVLDGYNAMGFVRFRHTDSDFARTDRQHAFMFAFKSALMKNPQVLPRVMDASATMLSDGLSKPEVLALGQFVRTVPKQNIRFGALPVYDVANYNLRVRADQLQAVLRQYNLLEGAPSAR